MPACTTRMQLVAKQAAIVVKLKEELATHIKAGDERAAHFARFDIAAAESLARLIHKH